MGKRVPGGWYVSVASLLEPVERFIGKYADISLQWQWDERKKDTRMPLRLRAAEEVAGRLREWQMRAKGLTAVLAQRCDEEFGNSPDQLALRVAYTVKAVLCLAFLREGWHPSLGDYQYITAASFDYMPTYAGWEAQFVHVAEPWWKNFYYTIEQDGDWNM